MLSALHARHWAGCWGHSNKEKTLHLKGFNASGWERKEVKTNNRHLFLGPIMMAGACVKESMKYMFHLQCLSNRVATLPGKIEQYFREVGQVFPGAVWRDTWSKISVSWSSEPHTHIWKQSNWEQREPCKGHETACNSASSLSDRNM